MCLSKCVWVEKTPQFLPALDPIVSQSRQCAKIVRIWNFSGQYFPTFVLNTEILRISPYLVQMQENTDQKISEYGHFSRNEINLPGTNLIILENLFTFPGHIF